MSNPHSRTPLRATIAKLMTDSTEPSDNVEATQNARNRVVELWLRSGGATSTSHEHNTAPGPPGTVAVHVLVEEVATWAEAFLERHRVVSPRIDDQHPSHIQLDQIASALELAHARSNMVRFPDPALRTVLAIRGGKTSTTVTRASDPTGKTFAIAAPDRRLWDLRSAPSHWDLRAPSGVGITIPSIHETTDAGTLTRIHLTGAALRAWLAAWRLTAEYDETHPDTAGLGLFEYDLRHVLLDFYGLKPETTTVKGKRYQRAPRDAERQLHTSLARLASTFIYGIGKGTGKIVPSTPQRLIAWYEDGERQRSICHHAHIAVTVLRTQFVQVPTQVLRLPADDAPLGLGLSSLWRKHITHALRGTGHYHGSLRTLAETVGEDWHAGERRYGHNGYWSRLLERVTRTIRSADLGTFECRGEGPTATVVLEPSATLATVYQRLHEASERWQEHERACTEETKIRAALAATRRRGRPRKLLTAPK
jgi:hypothetical protein